MQFKTSPDQNEFPEPDGGFPEPDDDFPEADDDFPEPDDDFPEADDDFPEADDDFPEADDEMSEPDDDFLEADDEILELDLSNRNLRRLPTDFPNRFPNLEYLNISNNFIRDLKPLHDLRNLKVLIADNNQISDINNIPLSLAYVSVNTNKIRELSNLNPSLQSLFVRDNEITTLNNLPELVHLDARDNSLRGGISVSKNVPFLLCRGGVNLNIRETHETFQKFNSHREIFVLERHRELILENNQQIYNEIIEPNILTYVERMELIFTESEERRSELIEKAKTVREEKQARIQALHNQMIVEV